MNPKLDNLYRQVIMEHYKHPRHKGLKGYSSIRIKNPSCGDDITIEANTSEGLVLEVNHEGSGCSICCSSASILSELASGKTETQVKQLIHLFSEMIQGKELSDQEVELLEEAMVYQGVSKFPARIKCATLPWKALEKRLGGEENDR